MNIASHVHRISTSLGWLPAKSTAEQAFFHLDSRIPADLKYSLHQLFVRHGRGCRKCSSNGVVSMDFVAECALEAVGVTRLPVKKRKAKKVKKEESD